MKPCSAFDLPRIPTRPVGTCPAVRGRRAAVGTALCLRFARLRPHDGTCEGLWGQALRQWGGGLALSHRDTEWRKQSCLPRQDRQSLQQRPSREHSGGRGRVYVTRCRSGLNPLALGRGCSATALAALTSILRTEPAPGGVRPLSQGNGILISPQARSGHWLPHPPLTWPCCRWGEPLPHV